MFFHELPSLANRRWHIQATSAITGQGLYEGLAWISNELEKSNVKHSQSL